MDYLLSSGQQPGEWNMPLLAVAVLVAIALIGFWLLLSVPPKRPPTKRITTISNKPPSSMTMEPKHRAKRDVQDVHLPEERS